MASYATPSLSRGITSYLDPKSSARVSSVHASQSSSIHPASCFSGSKIKTAAYLEPQRRAGFVSGSAYATAATAAIDTGVKLYTLPTWAAFEMGEHPVYWETMTGRPPASGELLTIYFNPAASNLVPNPDYGFAFNGGFNQPIMCGGEPRVMTRRDRGIKCTPFYIIKINVPLHALTIEFSFTNGSSWDGPYKLKFEIPAKWRRMPLTFFNEGLAKELSNDGACESAIYPNAAFVQDRCVFPAALIHQGGDRCELDIVPGCIDPESPFFDPLANRDDGSCPFFLDEFSDSE